MKDENRFDKKVQYDLWTKKIQYDLWTTDYKKKCSHKNELKVILRLQELKNNAQSLLKRVACLILNAIIWMSQFQAKSITW